MEVLRNYEEKALCSCIKGILDNRFYEGKFE